MLQNIPDCLLLGQYEPPLWSRRVDRHDKNYKVSRRDQIAHDLSWLFFFWEKLSYGFFQPKDAFFSYRADKAGMIVIFCPDSACKIRLVIYDQVGQLSLPDQIKNSLLKLCNPRFRIRDHQSDVCLSQHFFRLFHPLFSQLSLVIQAGGIDHNNRSQRQKFHGLEDRICGRAFHI